MTEGAEDGSRAVAPEAPNLVPSSVRELCALYAKELCDVEFPDVSASILERAAEELNERGQALDVARAQLLESEAAVEASSAALLRLAERGLAYARVYAAEDTDLSEKLAAIKLESERRRGKGGRKPRAPRAESAASGTPPTASSRGPSAARSAANGSATIEDGATESVV